LRYGLLWR
jgi:hypothetical protein